MHRAALLSGHFSSIAFRTGSPYLWLGGIAKHVTKLGASNFKSAHGGVQNGPSMLSIIMLKGRWLIFYSSPNIPV